jgi:hypothetical protein
VYPWDFKGSTRQTAVKPGSGYKFYIQNHIEDGPLGEVEYRAFLNMWLCRFIFCGKANEPTLNHIVMATQLAGGKRIPLENTSWVVCIICFIRLSPKCILARRYYVSTVLGGSYRCGCNCTCTRLLALTSTTGSSLHPAIMKGKLKSPEDAKPMERLLQLFPLIRMSASFSSSSSEVSLTLFGFLTWTMII